MMKILVSDFDNTFFSKDYLKNIELVNKFVDAGNVFIIATGRSINNLNYDIQNYHIKYSYLICSDGASIYDNRHNNLYTCNIPENIVNPICDMLDADDNVELTLVENDNFVSKTIANSIAAKFFDRSSCNGLISKLETTFKDIYAYLSENYINVRNRQVSKDKAIQFLIKMNNYNILDVYTVGDSINDIEMCKKFTSFTFDYACEEIKKISNIIVHDFEDVINYLKEKD